MHPSETLGSDNRRVNSIEREFTFARERNSLSLLQEQAAELTTLLDNTQREIEERESQNSRHQVVSDSNIREALDCLNNPRRGDQETREEFTTRLAASERHR